MKTIKNEIQKDETCNNEQRLTTPWENIQRSNLHANGVPRGEGKSEKKIFLNNTPQIYKFDENYK